MTAACNKNVTVSLRTIYPGTVGIAESRRRFDERVEYRLQIKRRTTDNFQHVGGGRLLLQRLTQLVKQSRVLDGNDGLRREILNQFDLLVGEGTNFLPVR